MISCWLPSPLGEGPGVRVNSFSGLSSSIKTRDSAKNTDLRKPLGEVLRHFGGDLLELGHRLAVVLERVAEGAVALLSCGITALLAPGAKPLLDRARKAMSAPGERDLGLLDELQRPARVLL